MGKLGLSTVDRAVALYLRCITGEANRFSLRSEQIVSRLRRMTPVERDQYYRRTNAINLDIDGQQQAIASAEMSDWGWMAQ